MFHNDLKDLSERSGAAGSSKPVTESPGDRIERLRNSVRILLKSTGWSNAEASRRSDIPSGTFSEWMSGKYLGNNGKVADRIDKWLSTEDATLANQSALIMDCAYTETSLSRQVVQALTLAQSQPTMALITMGSGLGKTTTCEWYAKNRTHAYRVAIEPIEGKPNQMLRKIAATLGMVEQPRITEISKKIAERLRRHGGVQPLLMIDEAQNLTDEAVNQLRFLLDEAKCGLALAGNEDLMVRYRLAATTEGFGQIHRRVGVRVHVKTAPAADVDMILDGLEITDVEQRRLGHLIASRNGGLGQVVDTFKLASILAFGAGRMITASDVKAAWQNRTREELGR